MKTSSKTGWASGANHSLSLRLCEWFFWVLVGAVCFGYTTFWSNFSELNIQFAFLDFPIFIGEICLGLCLLLFAVYQKIGRFPLKKWHAAVFVYILWLLFKALSGYHQYGPLAFRNAALFYYPLFAVLSFSFYKREFFNEKTIFTLFAVIVAARLSINFSTYYYYPALGLLAIFLLMQKKNWVKYPGLLLLFTIFPPKIFLYDSKSAIIANMVAISVLVLSGIFLVRIKLRYKLIFCFGVVFLSAFILLTFGRSNQIASLKAPLTLVEQIKEADEYVQLKKKQGFKSKPLAVSLYDPDKISLGDNYFLRVSSGANTEVENPAVFSDETSMIKFAEQKGEVARITVNNAINQLREDAIVALKSQVPFVEKQKWAIGLLEPKILSIRKEAIASVEQRKEKILTQVRSGVWGAPNVKDLKISNLTVETDEILRSAIGRIFAAKDDLVAMAMYRPQELKKASLAQKKSVIEEITRVQSKQQVKKISKVNEGAVSEAESESKKTDCDKECASRFDLKTEEQIANAYDKNQKNPDGRPVNQEFANMLFRFFIWRDMFKDMQERPSSFIFGLSFGMPQRSSSLEILVSAYGEWMRDGWIAAHNSYLDMIYRAGIVGVAMTLGLFAIFWVLLKDFIVLRAIPGLVMVSVIAYWLTLANFLVFLELPHQAIPFWIFLGMVLRYWKDLKVKSFTGKKF